MSTSPRRVVLGVLVLVLPCLVIATMGVLLIRQGRRMVDTSRQVEEQQRFDQVGRELAARLERLMLDQAATLAASGGALVPSPTHPEIALVGWVRDERLILPWEVIRPPDPAAVPNRAFLAALREGQHAESAAKNLPEAMELYGYARRVAGTPAEEDEADLRRARVMVKEACECTSEARVLFERLLGSTTVDDQGVPLALYAARQLIVARANDAAVLDMFDRGLQVDAWLGPPARYMQRDLLDSLATSASVAADQQRARTHRAALQPAIGELEQQLALQREFMRLMPTTGSAAGSPGAPVWVPYFGSTVWFVGVAPALAGLPPLAMAVRADAALAALERDPANVNMAPKFSFDRDAGQLVGHGFPDLRVRFAPVDNSPVMQNWRLQQTFYGIVLASVMGLALAGGYLFWRDIQRELRLAELRSQFVASVSHELKTPLTAIRMFAETLQLDRMPDLETRRQYLDTIVNESERLTRLINNVLDVSKIERGEKVYRLEPAPLAPVVRDAVTAMHYPLVRMGFDLRADLREDVPDVRIDPDGIRQAVLNLLSNAIKYSAERRHVDVTLQRVNGDAIIAVTDYGIGIPLGEQRRIFDRFYRAPVSENERIPGTGLGLALVQHIVRAHHGRIEVRSAPGEGSTFAIHLPFSTEAPDRQGHT